MKSLALAIVVVSLVACGGGQSPPAAHTGDAPEIARVHKSRCGACHERVEPGERSRAELEDAFTRHRKRVKLTEPQWAELVDYLAAPAKEAQSRAIE